MKIAVFHGTIQPPNFSISLKFPHPKINDSVWSNTPKNTVFM